MLHSKLTIGSQQLNEIMPMIYKRFTEKSAEEWRQIYKALQLMEFLVKNGSERVIDDARSHLSLLKMLRQFHYIDQNGKDQGINVRNRSKELTELLSDVDRIRQERKKARQTKNKYGGVEGGTGGLGFSSGAGSSGRYGGFGSESAGAGSSSYGGSTRTVYGDGGGFGGEHQMDYGEDGPRGGADRFDEYDEFDDGGAQAAPGRRRTDAPAKRTTASKKAAAPAKPKEPEVDLFDFGDDEPAPAPSNGTASSSAAILAPPASQPVAAPADDDDFDDFQSATPATAPAAPAQTIPSIPKPNYSSFSTATTTSSTQYAQPTPQSGAQKADFSNLFSTTSPPPSSTGTPLGGMGSPGLQQKPAGYTPSGPNYFQSVQVANTAGSSATSGVKSPAASIGAKPAAKSGGGDAFASLLSGSGMKKNGPAQKGMTIADMAKQKSQAGLYGANAPAAAPQSQPTQQQKPNTGSSGLDDLLG